jgi:hypothetical protein
MTSIFQALGFKSAATLDNPESIYLGNDKAACNAAITKAIAANKFARIYRQSNPLMQKVGQEQVVLAKVDCSPEANRTHFAKLKADAIAANAKLAAPKTELNHGGTEAPAVAEAMADKQSESELPAADASAADLTGSAVAKTKADKKPKQNK